MQDPSPEGRVRWRVRRRPGRQRVRVGAGGDEHVPAVAVRVGHHPGVAEGFVVPLPVGELLVPAGVGGQDGSVGFLRQVIRSVEVA